MSTHGLWAASAPPGPVCPELAAETTADVVIIGGGFTGCSAALHLAQAGRRPVILEAEEVGFGGAGRNVGLVNAGLWVMPDRITARLGELRGERLLRHLGDAPRVVFDLIEKHAIRCQPRSAGTLHCALGESGYREIQERARQWQARGADVELLDARQTAARVGSSRYTGALLDRRAGTIQPLAYVRGLAHAAMAAGAGIHAHSAVIGYELLGTAWKVRTARGSVTAPCVIVATDAYSHGVSAALRREQVMLPYFNLATAPLAPAILTTILPEGQGVWDTRTVLSSVRLDASGRLIFGSVGALRAGGAATHRAWARRELARIFPQLRPIRFEHEWYGLIGMTDDALPRFHELGRNMYSISGYNGRGIGPGTLFGRDLARLALEQVAADELALPLTPLRTARFRALKGALYEFGAQAVHWVSARY